MHEHNHGALGSYAFEHLPSIGDTINIRQTDKSTYFSVVDVEHNYRPGETGEPHYLGEARRQMADVAAASARAGRGVKPLYSREQNSLLCVSHPLSVAERRPRGLQRGFNRCNLEHQGS